VYCTQHVRCGVRILRYGNKNAGMVVLHKAMHTAIAKAQEHGFGICGRSLYPLVNVSAQPELLLVTDSTHRAYPLVNISAQPELFLVTDSTHRPSVFHKPCLR
jgi:hypothetical protein